MILYKEKILSDDDCVFISNWILENENDVKALGPDIYGGTSDDSLTGRHPFFNYFIIDEIRTRVEPGLKSALLSLNHPNKAFIQCWANTFRKNEGILLHNHAAPDTIFLSGNLFLAGPTKPGTSYVIDGETVDIENSLGELVLFRSDLLHAVQKNTSDVVRISMAFDIHDTYRKLAPSGILYELYLDNEIRKPAFWTEGNNLFASTYGDRE